MSKNMHRQTALPGVNQVEEMKRDLNFKQRQLNEAESTAASLQVEVEARKADLEKITNLEGRMDKEMEVYQENINRMEDEMNKFRSELINRESSSFRKTGSRFGNIK